MFGIGDYFKKIKGSFAEELFIRKTVCDVIKEETGGDVSVDSLKFQAGMIFLDKVSNTLKSAVFIKKQAILKKISERQNLRVVKDIK